MRRPTFGRARARVRVQREPTTIPCAAISMYVLVIWEVHAQSSSLAASQQQQRVCAINIPTMCIRMRELEIERRLSGSALAAFTNETLNLSRSFVVCVWVVRGLVEAINSVFTLYNSYSY